MSCGRAKTAAKCVSRECPRLTHATREADLLIRLIRGVVRRQVKGIVDLYTGLRVGIGAVLNGIARILRG